MDPDAGTPAGAIYQLPLDQARVDAAPRRTAARPSRTGDGDSGASGAGGSQTRITPTPASALRSENGFGSSSVVPGTGATGSATGSDAGSATGSATGSDAGANSVTGSSRPDTKASSSPSMTRVYLLLALVLAVGIAGGLATRVRGHGDTSV